MSILPSDITSFVWGIALGVIGAFSAGFLKKAGEDFYARIMKKISPKASDEHAPQVIIQVARNDNVVVSGEALANELEPTSIERISRITFDEIRNAIEKAPPLQRENVQKSYVGLRIEWDTFFKSGSRRDGDMALLLLTTDSRVGSNTIWCEVPFSEYRELGILPAGAKIRVTGEITEVNPWDVKLKDARLHIYGK
jgi:hypothetical protein